MTTWQPPGPGALDDLTWPDKLAANAIDAGASDDRIHGYAVLGDLARHYSASEIFYLSIVEELPDERSAQIFELATTSLAAMSPREAPTHIAVLSRICGAHLASALGAGVVAPAESARALVADHAALLEWFASSAGELPAAFINQDAADTWTATLVEAAAALGLQLTLLRPDMTRDAARLALLYEAGLRRAEQIEATIVGARFPGLAAESLRTGPEHLRLYPVKLPPYHYVDREDKR